MDEPEQAAPFSPPPDPPPPDPPTQLELEQAIAERVAPEADTIPELEVSVQELTRVRQDLEAALRPIEEAKQDADEAKAAVEAARAEVDRVAELEREAQAREEQQQAEQARRAEWAVAAQAEDAEFQRTYGSLSQDILAGAAAHVRANVPEDALAKSWSGEVGLSARMAYMQKTFVEAEIGRRYLAGQFQPKQAPAPRPVEQPRPAPRQEVYQPRIVDDGESPLSVHAAARLALARRSK